MISDVPMRLDAAMLSQSLVPSRARAQALVAEGKVQVNGKPALKSSQKVGAKDVITLDEEGTLWASRAAHKLIHALDSFNIEVRGKTAIDLGASTGGFCHVLLERGVSHLTAVDVGHSQLLPDLAKHPRLTSLEQLNVKDLTPEHLAYAPEIITADLSFISLQKALPAALALRAPNATLVALIKPQFEVGKAGIGKGGLVKDNVDVPQLLADICRWLCEAYGARVSQPVASPIKGGDGNQEYLIAARFD
jgi:23S rRNA (cytidine1920-2'-O)/16S rRNA (cytidine1409-2'-O)-methyltransferase